MDALCTARIYVESPLILTVQIVSNDLIIVNSELTKQFVVGDLGIITLEEYVAKFV